MGNREVLLLHTVYAMITVGSLYYDINYAKFIPNESMLQYGGFGGKFRYLTFITMWLQTGYWCICVLAGLSVLNNGKKDRSGFLFRLVDYLHSSLAFPTGIFVCVTFWMIYAVDRELVFPKKLDAIIPPWLNHVMHTLHFPFLFIDKYITPHKYPRSVVGMSILILFAAAYQCWILYLGVVKEIWVYPILKVMDWPMRLVFFALLWVFFLLLYKTGAFVSMKFWGRKMKAK